MLVQGVKKFFILKRLSGFWVCDVKHDVSQLKAVHESKSI